MNEIFALMLKAYSDTYKSAKEKLISEGCLFEEENTLLLAETVELVKEIEAIQLQLSIDKALDERDYETCRKLVALCK